MTREHKLNCVMLIDDDDATNFIHSYLFKKTNFTKTIIVKENGEDALDYLLDPDDENCIKPDAIFLDLNMPLMDGWQFLEEYMEAYKDKKDQVRLFILTNSDNPDDIARAQNLEDVLSYQHKPLKREVLDELHTQYFS